MTFFTTAARRLSLLRFSAHHVHHNMTQVGAHRNSSLQLVLMQQQQHHQRRQLSSAAQTSENDSNSSRMTPQGISSQQTKLLQEATYLTRTLYRKCLQSIKVIAKGNERDEADFTEREMEERNQFDGNNDVNLKQRISMAPPVNRQNELSSRSEYYKTFTRENFDGHWNLLGEHGFHIGDEGNMRHGLGVVESTSGGWNQYQGGHHHLGGQMAAQYQGGGGGLSSTEKTNRSSKGCHHYTWREDQIEQFVYLIRSGEEKRQWILNDYEFDDPCSSMIEDDNREKSAIDWPHELEERLKNFESESNILVKEMYQRKGWMHSSEYSSAEDDEFWSDSDSDDDR